MAPGITIDNTSDFSFAPPSAKSQDRTLLLAPPSIASHPDALNSIVEAHDRNATDIQMLDRLALGLVSLPASTYDLVLLLTNVDGSREPLNRAIIEKLVPSLKDGGKLKSQDGQFGTSASTEQTEAILAGLVQDVSGGMSKPAQAAAQTVTLSFGKKKKANASAVPLNNIEAINKTIIETPQPAAPSAPAGVGFDMGDDLDVEFYDEDEEMELPSKEELLAGSSIDPNTLLSEEDRKRPINIPEACKPNGKRRRACKDCTCGLKQKIDAEDKAKREAADSALQTMKLDTDDLAEVDFTVQGKVGSCGNCALGDAFRCDGCPYIGLPAFKPGEEVRLLNNDIQL
ncbi:hypothetical protein VTO58DRAFT_108039 [Aureobasidium pullulans]|nr:hypothetical protein JADG_004773 [Aureobasidium pullulans]THY99674.1 DUF689-domain-containing protein [Aureobasidium pullulans]TIA11103.1 DUF689-domain-containing protein [Aureobasidium pullulans]